MRRDEVDADISTRCIHAACARALPHRVNFCPYCGTGQHAGVMKPGHAIVGEELPFVAPLAPTPTPTQTQTPPAPSVPLGRQGASMPAPPVAASPFAAQPPDGPFIAPPPRRAPATAAVPPRREPVRMRYWVLALALLWAIWIVARPSAKRIDARIDRAIALAGDCDANAAQAELIALRGTKATPEQLERLQKGLNDAGPVCEKKRQRAKAWTDTVAAVDGALGADAYDKALARLALFTRRYGDDSATRELKARIESARSAKTTVLAPPLTEAPAQAGAPAPSAQTAQSARNLINDAERQMALANYKAAADRMDVCVTMVDAANKECIALKARAERLNRDMQRCVAGGSEWIGERCQ